MENKKNVDIIQQAFADFGKGNIEGITKVCSSDIIWASYDNPDVPYAGTFKGREGVKDFFTKLSENVDYSNFEPKEFMSDGDRVVVLGHHTATVKKTRKTFDHDWCMVFRIREDQVASYVVFVDTRDQAQAFTRGN